MDVRSIEEVKPEIEHDGTVPNRPTIQCFCFAVAEPDSGPVNYTSF